MKVLVACEYSGVVRDAFTARGHEAWSCDLLPTDRPGLHHEGDIIKFMQGNLGWDLVIAHPPCTYMTNSGVCWLHKDPTRWDRLGWISSITAWETIYTGDVFNDDMDFEQED